jgi:hypothetical protein
MEKRNKQSEKQKTTVANKAIKQRQRLAYF